MWLDRLKELKIKKDVSNKQIADGTHLPERTVSRIFSGDTDNPYVDTLYRIVSFLGGSLDDIFAEGSAVVGNKNLKDLQDEVEIVKAERDVLVAEAAIAKDKITALSNENELLKMQLKYKDEIISLHNYYNKLKTSE
jgi:transcriptional regulator with XRE-family HTH domain